MGQKFAKKTYSTENCRTVPIIPCPYPETLQDHSVYITLSEYNAELFPILIYRAKLYPILTQWTELYPTLLHWAEHTCPKPSRQSTRMKKLCQPIRSESSANQNRVLRHPSRVLCHPSRVLRHPRAPGTWRSLLGSSRLAMAHINT